MIIDIDPRVDIVFKKLFGSPDHPNLTMSFVNAVLQEAGLPEAISLTIKNPFRLAEFEDEKSSELDILYHDQAGNEIQLEMQIECHAGLAQRMVHNWAQLYTHQLARGHDYKEHSQVLSIWILNEPMFGDGRWFHLFRFCCLLTGMLLHEDACIMTIELPVWTHLNRGGEHGIFGGVEKWNYFLTRAGGQEADVLLATLRDPVFKEAVELMTDFTRSQKLRHAYDMRQNYQHIIASYKRTGFEAGLEEGRAAGLAEGKLEGKAEGKTEGKAEFAREMARKLLAKGLPIEDIADITGLSAQELSSI